MISNPVSEGERTDQAARQYYRSPSAIETTGNEEDDTNTEFSTNRAVIWYLIFVILFVILVAWLSASSVEMR